MLRAQLQPRTLHDAYAAHAAPPHPPAAQRGHYDLAYGSRDDASPGHAFSGSVFGGHNSAYTEPANRLSEPNWSASPAELLLQLNALRLMDEERRRSADLSRPAQPPPNHRHSYYH